MIRDILTAAYVLVVALGLGIWSAIKATSQMPFFAEMDVGVWTAHPSVGTDDADPYTHAWLARTGAMPLASGEGLAFTATHDESGEKLNAACRYAVSGATPPARRWTIRTVNPTGDADISAPDLPVTAYSGGIIRRPDGSFDIDIARQPQPGNWLHPGPGPVFAVTLTLYDTSVASSTALSDIVMPSIVNLGCGNV